MSETVHYRGVARKIDFTGLTLDEQADWLTGNGYAIDPLEYCEDRWVEDDRIMIVGNDVYAVVEEFDIDLDEEIIEAEKRSDGMINFELKYYNGGASKAEAFSQALNKLK